MAAQSWPAPAPEVRAKPLPRRPFLKHRTPRRYYGAVRAAEILDERMRAAGISNVEEAEVVGYRCAKILSRKGFVTFTPGLSRTLQVTPAGFAKARVGHPDRHAGASTIAPHNSPSQSAGEHLVALARNALRVA